MLYNEYKSYKKIKNYRKKKISNLNLFLIFEIDKIIVVFIFHLNSFNLLLFYLNKQ